MRPFLTAALACALATVATPAQGTGCFTFTDATGDTEIGLVNVADSEPDLDIVGVEYLTTTTDIGARIEVATLGTTPAKAPGDVFQVGFTSDGFYFDIFAERIAGNVILGTSDPAGLTVTGTVDAATNSVTVTVAKADIQAQTGVAPTRLEDLNAGTFADYGVQVPYDEAFPAGTTSYTVGSTCH